MSANDTSKRILTLGLLLLLVWGRVWAGVPQSMPHPHDEQAGGVSVVDTCGHNLTVADHLAEHGSASGAVQTAAPISAEDGDEHHHHVHLCSLAGSALTSNTLWNLSVSKPVLFAAQPLSAVIRRPQPLLRPPQV